jgi:transcriptional regulator with XRE-family HTH domain
VGSSWVFDPGPMRATRERLGLTVTAFARRVHSMSGNQVKKIEERRRTVTVSTLVRICDAYNIAPATFFRRT